MGHTYAAQPANSMRDAFRPSSLCAILDRGGGMKNRVIAALLAFAAPAAAQEPGWPHYGGEGGGQRRSAAAEITPANVSGLVPAWHYSTGALTAHARAM